MTTLSGIPRTPHYIVAVDGFGQQRMLYVQSVYLRTDQGGRVGFATYVNDDGYDVETEFRFRPVAGGYYVMDMDGQFLVSEYVVDVVCDGDHETWQLASAREYCAWTAHDLVRCKASGMRKHTVSRYLAPVLEELRLLPPSVGAVFPGGIEYQVALAEWNRHHRGSVYA